MIVNHNISSIFAARHLDNTNQELDGNIEKLSSGLRINRAGDDASGLAVSEKMRSQVSGLQQAMQNAEDGISFLQTAEGYLQETTDILQRMRELAIQAGNGIYSDDDRQMINMEISQLIDEVDRIASQANFNGVYLLTGRFSRALGDNADAAMTVLGGGEPGVFFHIGANMDEREQVFIGTMSAQALGLRGEGESAPRTISMGNMDSANYAIGKIDEAITTVMKQRADLGSYQNRFEKIYDGLAVAAENMTAAESRIRDTDMAEEMSDFVKNQILAQANVTMLAQANLKPQLVLRLLS